MVTAESKQSPSDPKNQPKQSNSPSNGKKDGSIFSPRLKSAAALAGWDEEALLIASLVVEDTPDRQIKHRKRSDLNFKTPPSSSRRKRRNQKRSPISITVPVLDLDDEETVKEDNVKKKTESDFVIEEKKNGEDATLPSMDRLREELSCAICLEICFEPSTTPCGHSFCKKCLRSAADKCGKRCPKCRQLISNGRSCTINTVLWNTIQLLFPQEIKTRKKTAVSNGGEADCQTPERLGVSRRNDIARRIRGIRRRSDEDAAMAQRLLQRDDENVAEACNHGRSVRDAVGRRRGGRRSIISQDEDAAMALRLQREEFMEVFREQPRNSVSLARANLRAMASRAMDIRIRGRLR